MLSGFDLQFTNFGTIVVDAGASWTVDTSDTLNATVIITDKGRLANAGTILSSVTVTNGAAITTIPGAVRSPTLWWEAAVPTPWNWPPGRVPQAGR